VKLSDKRAYLVHPFNVRKISHLTSTNTLSDCSWMLTGKWNAWRTFRLTVEGKCSFGIKSRAGENIFFSSSRKKLGEYVKAGGRYLNACWRKCMFVTVPNFVVLVQTVWAYKRVKNWGSASLHGPRSLRMGHGCWLTPKNMPIPTWLTVPNLIVLQGAPIKSMPLLITHNGLS